MTNMKQNATADYGYYSKKLNKPFETLAELRAAEAADQAEREKKAAAAKAKKEAAESVENSYRQLNAAKRKYKEDLDHAAVKYIQAVKIIQQEFEADKKKAAEELAKAEETYKNNLREFNEKHPEGFHITLKDGDYETSIAKSTNGNAEENWITQLFSELFNA